LGAQKIKHYIKGILNAVRGRREYYVEYNSYSQAGEDAVLKFLITDKKLREVKYLDLGTNIPDFSNNTYFLYKMGNRGVCVEANKSLIGHIREIRPEDKVINAGVSISDQKEADFYIFKESGLNTFDKEEAEKRASFGSYKILEVVKVPLISVNRVIEENFRSYPDFLSVDIEGLDLAVLKSLDFNRFPIPIICVETCIYSENHIRPKDEKISDFLKTKGYEVYADTYINTIFVNKNWFYQVG
jgi:FkbM family methyltransferase